ncbi:MAG: DegT/DnrJ/EryC1/StrS family aminotransferase [Treponema sp.]|jgi:dTDP-4-amino-4,6-dideoxygalactose transaminase|nr:DegT/DnrJ/EryC1/StrS family aminotransferase [Treponema sp.]
MKIEVYSPTIRRKEMDAVLTAMVEEKIGVGDRNRLLIQTAKEQIKFDYALALRSPAVALYLALKAAMESQNAQTGQAVVISALSPRYYYQVIEDLKLTPLYCDVSYDFPCMSREAVENAVSQKPSGVEICAVVIHHTLGFQPDSKAIAELGFPVIEDVSQSYGKIIKKAAVSANSGDGASSGASADNSASADGADKEKEEPQIKTSGAFCILGLEERDMLTSGGGALLFAMNRKDSSGLRNFAGIANEYCLPDINAALAVVQFKEVQRNLQKRREIAAVYAQAGLRTRHKRFIPIAEDDYNNYSFSLVLETGLKDVIAYARKKDIIVESAFENTLAASGLCGNCPVGSSLALRTVLFPLYPRLRSSDAERVSRLIMTLP